MERLSHPDHGLRCSRQRLWLQHQPLVSITISGRRWILMKHLDHLRNRRIDLKQRHRCGRRW
jgi:hypothetical protein